MPARSLIASQAWAVPISPARRRGRRPRRSSAPCPARAAPGKGTGRSGRPPVEDAELALEALDRPVDERLARDDAGVVHEVAGGEVVRAVDHDVAGAHQVEGIGPGEPDRTRGSIPIAELSAARRRAAASALFSPTSRREEHLALEVRGLDPVRVDDHDPPHAGRREVQQRRAAQAARADDEHRAAPSGFSCAAARSRPGRNAAGSARVPPVSGIETAGAHEAGAEPAAPAKPS
jgi:hypothetical protein